jgi:hypothetical protein
LCLSVPFLVVIDQGLRGIVDLHMVHRCSREVKVSNFVDSVVSIVSNNWFSNNFIFDLVFFPAFFLKVENII